MKNDKTNGMEDVNTASTDTNSEVSHSTETSSEKSDKKGANAEVAVATVKKNAATMVKRTPKTEANAEVPTEAPVAKTAPKKVAAKKKAPAKKTVVKKAATKKVAKKAPAKEVAAKKEVAVKAPVKKAAPKKAVAKTAPKKTVMSKTKQSVNNFDRNFARIKFDGQELSKGRAVHAVVAKFMADNPKTTAADLKAKFPDELLKNYGIVQEAAKARKYSIAGKTRFFVAKEDLLTTKDGKQMCVCNQFSTENVKPFMKHAKGLGYTMSEAKTK